jgi:hypothetical protein
MRRPQKAPGQAGAIPLAGKEKRSQGEKGLARFVLEARVRKTLALPPPFLIFNLGNIIYKATRRLLSRLE